MVVPTGNEEPLVCDEVKDARLQLSLAVGAVHVTVLEHEPAAAFCVMLLGIPEMVGLMASTIVMVNELVVTLPEASVAV